MVIAYSDASYDDKDKVAGIGVVIDKGIKDSPTSSWIPCCDVNYAELFAIYQAGILLGGRGIVYTDSQTAIDYIQGKIRDDKPRTHEQYIKHQQKKVLAYKINKLDLDVRKIKAHSKELKRGEINNNLADTHARKGLAKYKARQKLIDDSHLR
jgi:ribonuclease HI